MVDVLAFSPKLAPIEGPWTVKGWDVWCVYIEQVYPAKVDLYIYISTLAGGFKLFVQFYLGPARVFSSHGGVFPSIGQDACCPG